MLKEISKKVTIIYKSLGWENDPVYKKANDMEDEINGIERVENREHKNS